jgi:hypothetical protein
VQLSQRQCTMNKWTKELDNLKDLKEEIERMVYRD